MQETAGTCRQVKRVLSWMWLEEHMRLWTRSLGSQMWSLSGGVVVKYRDLEG